MKKVKYFYQINGLIEFMILRMVLQNAECAVMVSFNRIDGQNYGNLIHSYIFVITDDINRILTLINKKTVPKYGTAYTQKKSL